MPHPVDRYHFATVPDDGRATSLVAIPDSAEHEGQSEGRKMDMNPEVSAPLFLRPQIRLAHEGTHGLRVEQPAVSQRSLGEQLGEIGRARAP